MFNGYLVTFQGENCLGCDSDQAPPSTTKVGIISLFHPCTNVMWTGINVVVVVIVVVAVNVPQLHRRG